jgi:hypothetical protein
MQIQVIAMADQSDVNSKQKALAQENERLRKALEMIVSASEDHESCIGIASTALQGGSLSSE